MFIRIALIAIAVAGGVSALAYFAAEGRAAEELRDRRAMDAACAMGDKAAYVAFCAQEQRRYLEKHGPR